MDEDTDETSDGSRWTLSMTQALVFILIMLFAGVAAGVLL